MYAHIKFEIIPERFVHTTEFNWTFYKVKLNSRSIHSVDVSHIHLILKIQIHICQSISETVHVKVGGLLKVRKQHFQSI